MLRGQRKLSAHEPRCVIKTRRRALSVLCKSATTDTTRCSPSLEQPKRNQLTHTQQKRETETNTRQPQSNTLTHKPRYLRRILSKFSSATISANASQTTCVRRVRRVSCFSPPPPSGARSRAPHQDCAKSQSCIQIRVCVRVLACCVCIAHRHCVCACECICACICARVRAKKSMNKSASDNRLTGRILTSAHFGLKY